MPKTRKTKRKTPITASRVSGAGPSSNKPSATRAIIRRFHVLKKRQVQLQKSLHEGSTSIAAGEAQKELADIEREMVEIGGLEAYQKMSVIGQGSDRGGGSEKILLGFLAELGYPASLKDRARWKYVVSHLLYATDASSEIIDIECSKWVLLDQITMPPALHGWM